MPPSGGNAENALMKLALRPLAGRGVMHALHSFPPVGHGVRAWLCRFGNNCTRYGQTIALPPPPTHWSTPTALPTLVAFLATLTSLIR